MSLAVPQTLVHKWWSVNEAHTSMHKSIHPGKPDKANKRQLEPNDKEREQSDLPILAT